MPTLTAPPVPGGAASPTRRRLARGNAGRLILASYRGDRGPRAVCARRGPQGSVLVLDEDAAMLDRRLVAHLCADEPAANAAIAANAYLADSGRRARPLSDLDWVVAPDAEATTAMDLATELVDAAGTRYRLDDGHGPGLRWTRRAPGHRGVSVVCLRTVVGVLEDYEPARPLTRAALTAPGDQHHLAAELQALAQSPHVLNRLLRAAVLGRVASGEETLSNIAMRCGRPKAPGHHNGDTAWLRRRIGDAPEAGHTRPSPWIGCALLARIARDGLGIAPREVELA